MVFKCGFLKKIMKFMKFLIKKCKSAQNVYIYTFWEPWPEPLGTKNRSNSVKIHKNFMDFEGGARGPRSPPPRVEIKRLRKKPEKAYFNY